MEVAASHEDARSGLLGRVSLRAVIAIALLIAGCGKPRESDSTPDFVIGLCHVRSLEDARIAADLGTGSIRNTVLWRALEADPGRLGIPSAQQDLQAAARELGIALLTPVSYGNTRYDGGGYPVSEGAIAAFARSAGFAALALREPQPVFEIWNEWNLGIGMPSWAGKGAPEDYVRLQAAAYAAMKRVRNPPTVLGGGMAGAGLTGDWLERACEAGMLEHLDGLSFHPYCYWMEGAAAMPELGMLGLIASIEEIVDRFPGGHDVPLYLTEIGWPTHEGPDRVTLDEQAQYAARALLLARANPRIKGLWWFNLRDANSSSEKHDHRFGLLFSDGTPKPAFFAFRDTARLIGEAATAEHVRLGGTVHGVWLGAHDGGKVIALWIARPAAQARIELSMSGVSRASVHLLGSGETRTLEATDGKVTVSVGNMPVVIRGLGADAEILGYRVTGRESRPTRSDGPVSALEGGASPPP